LSPRAASRLHSLGFAHVYDYAAGKLDWLAAGMPTEGTNAGRRRAGDLARSDVPTCGLDDTVGDVRERIRKEGWDQCVVVDDRRVVLGVLRGDSLDEDAEMRAEDAMQPGPSTFRPYVSAQEMASYMADHDLESAPITRSDGTLVGVLMRDDAARAAGDS